MLGRKQQSQVARSFPNRYLFSFTNKVTSLFSISCILDIILQREKRQFDSKKDYKNEIRKRCKIQSYSVFIMLNEAEDEGFKPPIRERRIPDFESSAFGHSANLPKLQCKSNEKS